MPDGKPQGVSQCTNGAGSWATAEDNARGLEEDVGEVIMGSRSSASSSWMYIVHLCTSACLRRQHANRLTKWRIYSAETTTPGRGAGRMRCVMALHWRSICMPTDFSEASRPAFRTAIELAAHFDAELLLLYVQQIPAVAYSVVPLQGGVREEMDADARGLLEGWKRQAEAQGARRTRVTIGSRQRAAAETIR